MGFIMTSKPDIKSLSHRQLEDLIAELGYPAYRAGQIEEWLYARECNFISEMNNIPKDLRSQLENHFHVGALRVVTHQTSKDGTRKYLFELEDGACVETVGIPSIDGKRLTVCFSSQAGCPMGCTFCATGRAGFVRNLTSGEMYDQVRYVASDFNMRVSNVVCMGQGEPFLNYDATLEALRRMNSRRGLEIGARHITVSTCGMVEGIERLSREPEQFTLAVSLHSAIQDTRDRLMPGVSGVSLEELRDSIRDYGENTRRRPSLEYAPMKNMNDDDNHIKALVDFCRGMLCHVNLIPLNPIEGKGENEGIVQPSSKMGEFVHALKKNGIEHSVRNSRGKDIDGACGQLRQRVKQ